MRCWPSVDPKTKRKLESSASELNVHIQLLSFEMHQMRSDPWQEDCQYQTHHTKHHGTQVHGRREQLAHFFLIPFRAIAREYRHEHRAQSRGDASLEQKIAGTERGEVHVGNPEPRKRLIEHAITQQSRDGRAKLRNGQDKGAAEQALLIEEGEETHRVRIQERGALVPSS
jgi:hypothetical protein